MAIQIEVNAQAEVPTVKTIQVTKASVSRLLLNFDKTHALLQINYLDDAGNIVSTRCFKAGGQTYRGLIDQAVSGSLAEIVIGITANFATQMVANPEMIDGVDIVELNEHEFIHEIRDSQ